MSETAEEIDGEIVDVEEAAEEARNLPAVRAAEAMVTRAEVTPAEVKEQRDKVMQVMREVMVTDQHYGRIPGVQKPTLLKPGAELLAVTFRLAPHYHSERIFHDDGHLTVVSRVTLTHIPTGLEIAEGEGLCTSREKKYAYRGGGRTCPECEAAGTIKRSKYADRETGEKGWYCFAKIGGCGAQFGENDERIVSQDEKPIPNPDLADTFNTVLKMANKRALVAAILNGTAASDIFTQDVEDGNAEDSQAPSQQPVRRNVSEVKPPRTWQEVMERLATKIDDSLVWLQQAKDLKEQGKLPAPTLLQRLSGLVCDIDGWSVSEFPPRSRKEIQEAFAKRLEGITLDGPEWALDAAEAEAGRPQKDAGGDASEAELDKAWEASGK